MLLQYVLVDPAGTQTQEAIAPSLAGSNSTTGARLAAAARRRPLRDGRARQGQVIMADLPPTALAQQLAAAGAGARAEIVRSTPIVSQADRCSALLHFTSANPEARPVPAGTDHAILPTSRARHQRSTADAAAQSEARRAEAEREPARTIDTIPRRSRPTNRMNA